MNLSHMLKNMPVIEGNACEAEVEVEATGGSSSEVDSTSGFGLSDTLDGSNSTTEIFSLMQGKSLWT